MGREVSGRRLKRRLVAEVNACADGGRAAPSKPARAFKNLHNQCRRCRGFFFLQEEHYCAALAGLQLLCLLPLAFAVSFGDVPYLPWDV